MDPIFIVIIVWLVVVLIGAAWLIVFICGSIYQYFFPEQLTSPHIVDNSVTVIYNIIGNTIDQSTTTVVPPPLRETIRHVHKHKLVQTPYPPLPTNIESRQIEIRRPLEPTHTRGASDWSDSTN